MNKIIKLLTVIILSIAWDVFPGTVIGVQVQSAVNNGVVQLGDPTSTDPSNSACLYNTYWVDSDSIGDENGTHIAVTTPFALNGPVTSPWGYIEFYESVVSKCGWDVTNFSCPVTIYGELYATLTFDSEGNVTCSGNSCNSSTNISGLVSWMLTDCPSGVDADFCYTVYVGSENQPKNFCITNADSYFDASAMCVSSPIVGNYGLTVNPGETECYRASSSTTSDIVSIAGENIIDCDIEGSGCNVWCNVTSIAPTINADSTITVGCTDAGCKAADTVPITMAPPPAYQVISTTDDVDANAVLKSEKKKLKKLQERAKKKRERAKLKQNKKSPTPRNIQEKQEQDPARIEPSEKEQVVRETGKKK